MKRASPGKSCLHRLQFLRYLPGPGRHLVRLGHPCPEFYCEPCVIPFFLFKLGLNAAAWVLQDTLKRHQLARLQETLVYGLGV